MKLKGIQAAATVRKRQRKRDRKKERKKKKEIEGEGASEGAWRTLGNHGMTGLV